MVKRFVTKKSAETLDIVMANLCLRTKGGVEDTTFVVKAKDLKKIREQGPNFRGQNPLVAKSRNGQGQG